MEMQIRALLKTGKMAHDSLLEVFSIWHGSLQDRSRFWPTSLARLAFTRPTFLTRASKHNVSHWYSTITYCHMHRIWSSGIPTTELICMPMCVLYNFCWKSPQVWLVVNIDPELRSKTTIHLKDGKIGPQIENLWGSSWTVYIVWSVEYGYSIQRENLLKNYKFTSWALSTKFDVNEGLLGVQMRCSPPFGLGNEIHKNLSVATAFWSLTMDSD